MLALSDEEIFRLCDVVRETSFALHCYHGHGHFEKVYENGLASRLNKLGILAEQQAPIEIRDEDGTVLGCYRADILVAGSLILELKVCAGIADEHIAQAVGYLRGTGLRHALVINFGASKFQIRKVVL